MKLNELKNIAKKATPGPYKVVGNIPFYAVVEKPAPSLSKHDERDTYWRYEDGEFHAAFTPETVLKMIDYIEKLRAVLGQDPFEE